MIDYVRIQDLRCPLCGEITANDTVQSTINKDPHCTTYTVGSRFDLFDDVEGFEGGDYIPTRPDLEIGPRLRVLEVWHCHHCGESSLCVWCFEDKVLVEARLVARSLAVFREVELVTTEINKRWVQALLLEIYPDEEDAIEWLTLRECIEVAVSGRMIVTPDD